MISVDNGELMHRGSWCRGSTEEMGTLNQDSVWEADGEMSVKGERAGLSIPALASALSYLLGGMILECPRGFWKLSGGGTYKMRWVIGHIPGWR